MQGAGLSALWTSGVAITKPKREAQKMSRRENELSPPAGRDGLALVRSGREGVWWDRGDGLSVRLAAPERERGIERGRLSLLGMLIAFAASGDRSQ